MAKISVLVPIYLPHFASARNLLDSFNKQNMQEQADLWFIFTNEDEANSFGEYPHKLILPSAKLPSIQKGFITVKKFAGLKALQDLYEYIIVIDAESRFIKNVDLYKICINYFENKILLGNIATAAWHQEILQSCKAFFSKISYRLYVKDFNNPLYLWFNQPCIYKTAHLNNFWHQIDYPNCSKIFTFVSFDYYIYMYYLILFENFTIKDMQLSCAYGACENPGYIANVSKNTQNMPIYLSTAANLCNFDNENLFLEIHIDRSLVMVAEEGLEPPTHGL